MPKVTAMIGEHETGDAFEARIACVANHLVGNYGPTEHHSCAGQLHHGHLNLIF
jgi:hypothetical protein